MNGREGKGDEAHGDGENGAHGSGGNGDKGKPEEAEDAEAFTIEVDTLSFAGRKINVTDRSINPHYALHLQEIKGTIAHGPLGRHEA